MMRHSTRLAVSAARAWLCLRTMRFPLGALVVIAMLSGWLYANERDYREAVAREEVRRERRAQIAARNTERLAAASATTTEVRP